MIAEYVHDCTRVPFEGAFSQCKRWILIAMFMQDNHPKQIQKIYGIQMNYTYKSVRKLELEHNHNPNL